MSLITFVGKFSVRRSAFYIMQHCLSPHQVSICWFHGASALSAKETVMYDRCIDVVNNYITGENSYEYDDEVE